MIKSISPCWNDVYFIQLTPESGFFLCGSKWMLGVTSEKQLTWDYINSILVDAPKELKNVCYCQDTTQLLWLPGQTCVVDENGENVNPTILGQALNDHADHIPSSAITFMERLLPTTLVDGKHVKFTFIPETPAEITATIIHNALTEIRDEFRCALMPKVEDLSAMSVNMKLKPDYVFPKDSGIVVQRDFESSFTKALADFKPVIPVKVKRVIRLVNSGYLLQLTARHAILVLSNGFCCVWRVPEGECLSWENYRKFLEKEFSDSDYTLGMPEEDTEVYTTDEDLTEATEKDHPTLASILNRTLTSEELSLFSSVVNIDTDSPTRLSNGLLTYGAVCMARFEYSIYRKYTN